MVGRRHQQVSNIDEIVNYKEIDKKTLHRGNSAGINQAYKMAGAVTF